MGPGGFAGQKGDRFPGVFSPEMLGIMQRRPAVDQFEIDGTRCDALDEYRVETRLLELRGKGAADARIPPAVSQRRFGHDRAAGRSGHETDQQAGGKAEDVGGTEGVHPG
jgi:hypothetical protein